MANCARFLAIPILAFVAQAGIACSAEPYVSIQTLSVAQVAEIVKLNLREQYGADAPDNIAIDSSRFKTGDDGGKILSMRVSTAPWILTVSAAGSQRELTASDSHLYINPRNRVSDGTLPTTADIANKSEGDLPNAKANWRWDTGVRIKIPSGWKAE